MQGGMMARIQSLHDDLKKANDKLSQSRVAVQADMAEMEVIKSEAEKAARLAKKEVADAFDGVINMLLHYKSEVEVSVDRLELQFITASDETMARQQQHLEKASLITLRLDAAFDSDPAEFLANADRLMQDAEFASLPDPSLTPARPKFRIDRDVLQQVETIGAVFEEFPAQRVVQLVMPSDSKQTETEDPSTAALDPETLFTIVGQDMVDENHVDAVLVALAEPAGLKKLLHYSRASNPGMTSLHYAAFYGHASVLQGTVLQDEEFGTQLTREALFIQDLYGNTPLHWACDQGRPECIQVVIDLMPDVLAELEGGAHFTNLELLSVDKVARKGLKKVTDHDFGPNVMVGKWADGEFIGGGNTFETLQSLDYKLTNQHHVYLPSWGVFNNSAASRNAYNRTPKDVAKLKGNTHCELLMDMAEDRGFTPV